MVATTYSRPLRILHLSDLHERASFDGIPAERERLLALDEEERQYVLGERFREVLLQLSDVPIDIICVTGDVADWANTEEYHKALLRFREILSTTNLSPSRFFAVPGNHDVTRGRGTEAWRGLREWLSNGGRHRDLGRWFRHVAKTPLGINNPSWREELLQRTENFWQWLDDLGCPDLRPRPPQLLGYRHSIAADTFPHFPLPIHVLGFDSAWLCGDDSDPTKIVLTEEQVLGHIRPKGAVLDGLRIGLVHHPLEHLADHHEIHRLLADDGVDLLLHGHQHAPLSTRVNEAGIDLRVLAAGCLMEGDLGKSWPNGFQLIEVDHEKRCSIHFWKWSKSGRFWTRGSDIYRQAPGGILREDDDARSLPARHRGTPQDEPQPVDTRENANGQSPYQVHPSPKHSNFRAYPQDLIEKLDLLTCERARRRARDPLLEDEIRSLVRELNAYRAPHAGDIVLDAKLVEIIGAGNFGDVWRAQPIAGGPDVAVKVFHANKFGLHLSLHAFRRGVEAMHRLGEAPGKPATVIGVLSTDPAKTMYSMKLAERIDLGEACRNWQLDTKLKVFREVCEATCFAHQYKVLHRDIKPENILINLDLSAILSDFDIADLLYKKTLSTQSKGTVLYAAPEQLEGTAERRFTADVYSLGRVLHFLLLEANPPFAIDRVPLLEDLDAFPDGIVRIIRKCTVRKIEDRYQSVEGILADIDAFEKNPSTTDIGMGIGARRTAASQEVIVSLLFAALGVLVAFVFYPYRWKSGLDVSIVPRVDRSEREPLRELSGAAVSSAETLSSAVLDAGTTQLKSALLPGLCADKACTDIGDDYEKQGKISEAISFYEEGCKREEPDGCFRLGRMVMNGKHGFERDAQKSLTYFTKACSLGHKVACDDEASGLERNAKALEPTDKPKAQADYAAALRLYERACDQDQAVSCSHAAWFYKWGKAGEKDREKAVRLEAKACRLGHQKSCHANALASDKGAERSSM